MIQRLGPAGRGAAIVLVAGLALAAALARLGGDALAPVDLSTVAYVGSESCAACHPGRHQTWQRTYHRTMTQRASAHSVLGDFDNATHTFDGVTSHFTREDGRFWIETLSPGATFERYEVVMTVGSRRIQQYVTRSGDRHVRLPLAWNIVEGRWIHLNGAFLHPDGSDFNTHTALWDANCIFCHNVKAQPRYDVETGRFASRVEELGIACEACHGPGAAHLERQAHPLRRAFLRLRGRDPSMVSPRSLPERRQIQICGHCHGQRQPRPQSRIAEFMQVGDPYTAGEDLDRYTSPLFIDSQLLDIDLSLRFWADGTPRLSAYEYQGLLLSTAHQGSGLTCISCHNMHGGDPRGMIEDAMRGPLACTGCHREIAIDVPGHTRHERYSTGSDCYACHMPDVTYGLLEIHPTHRIRSPDPSRAWRHRMPEACTLCHTNRTAVWAAETLARQQASPPPADLPVAPEFGVAETVRALLSGDVLQRAVAVNALAGDRAYTGDPQARLWVVPFLLITMEDDYPALRHLAFRGLAERLAAAGLPLVADFDYLGAAHTREAAVAAYRRWWTGLDKRGIPHPGDAVPLDPRLEPHADRVATLLAAQESKIIAIGE